MIYMYIVSLLNCLELVAPARCTNMFKLKMGIMHPRNNLIDTAILMQKHTYFRVSTQCAVFKSLFCPNRCSSNYRKHTFPCHSTHHTNIHLHTSHNQEISRERCTKRTRQLVHRSHGPKILMSTYSCKHVTSRNCVMRSVSM